MRARALLIFLALALLSDTTPVQAQESQERWEVLENSEGVTSWRLVTADESAVFKGETEIPASIEVIDRVMQDAAHHQKWMHKCIASAELKRVSSTEAIIYNRTDSPWPVKDRDVVFTLKRSESPDGVVIYTFVDIRSDLKPEVDGVVRMPKMVGSWHLTPLSANRTKAVYRLETDVGGAIPRWAVTGTLERIPYGTVHGLRSYIATLRP